MKCGIAYMESELIAKKIEMLERELHELKIKFNSKKKRVKLKGLWKGVKFTGADFEDAKKSLFPHV